MSNRKPGRTWARAVRAPHDGPANDRLFAELVPSQPTPSRPLGQKSPASYLAVQAGEPPEHLFRRLLSAYLSGARSIHLEELPRLSPTTKDVVREFCRRTQRVELVQESGRLLGLAEADDGAEEGIDDRLRYLGERVVALHREAVAGWGELAFGDDASWERKDDEVDREAWYLERRLARGEGGQGPSRPVPAAWTVARSLERIADHAITLGEVGARLAELGPETGLLRELRQFHGQAMDHLEAVLDGPDGAQANDLLDVGEALAAAGRALSERLLPAVGDGSMSPALAAAVARALEAIGRTIAYTQDIAQTFLDRPSGGVPPVRGLSAVPVGVPARG
jgi:hypothetical protein